ncbi:MAG TPA: right-handed parallel beta-helix repeat-containing protein [Chthoniobacterales bacterium]
MKNRSTIRISFLLIFLTSLNCQRPALLAQGSLTPPSAPTPTMKSLDQVEARTPVDATHTPGDGTNLFIISQPGSYYLTGNIAGVGGKNGITITTENVTLDLNGFTIVGPGNTNNGVDCGLQKNIVIRNGTIRSWSAGVSSSTSAVRLRIEKVRTRSNASAGISLGGNCAVVDCLIEGSSTMGISVQGSGFIQNCQIVSCTIGISTGPNAMITGCHLSLDSLGISLGVGSVVNGCEIVSNTATGIIANSGCTIKDCTIASNSAKGIDTVTAGGTSAGTIIQNCLFSGNFGNSIDLSGSCIVRDCMIAPGSTGDGINMGTVSASWISNNQIRNAAASHSGINCNGNNNRIEGNTFTSNSAALAMGASSNSNLIIRNIFLANTTNYTNGGGAQKDAQIFNFGTGQVSTDPWENIR